MYIPLKVTTDYTLLKSLIKVPNLISFLSEKNIDVCGICDENLYGVLEFYYACKKNNIKPIVGLDVIIDDLNVYLYAMNFDGYKNLLKIHTLKEKNELILDDLSVYKDSILCIVPFKSKELFDKLKFFNNLYISYNNSLERLNALTITSNVLYINDLKALKKDDVLFFAYLDKLRKEEVGMYEQNYYFAPDIDLGKIDEVVSLLNLELKFNKKYIPKYKDNIDSSSFLHDLCFKGLTKRLNGKVPDIYLKRLNYELKIINEMGFVDYFLIVYDYVLYAKRHDILVGPGRGSAAGSLVSYSIGITEIDPLKYNLLFERFLNPERVTMPDIDVDFDALKREEIIEYVRNRYGDKNVALGLTFTTLKSKLVLREIGKLLKINDTLLDNFIKCINGNICLKDNLTNENIKKYLNNYNELKKLYNISMHLEGLKKNTSTHAAGVVISSTNLDEIIPIHYENNTLITGVTMDYLESIGLLKMDFLALKNLTTIKNILDEVGKDALKNIDLNDKAVLNLFCTGKTEGIFQFETSLMRNLIRKLKPSSFNDLVASLALGRPGALEEADEYIARKNGKKEITYIHKDLEPILKDTYGIILYQEQIIAILGKIGGYSLAEADIIRRAISKKKESVINAEKEKFINGAIGKGYDRSVATLIYDLIVKFASYGFNKAHSVAYARISYDMAYLKVKYPEYFIIEMINNKDNEKFAKLVLFLKNKGIKLEKPDVNLSHNKFYISGKELIMPLWQIKGIPENLSEKIIENRKDGYTDFFDFVCKNKKILNENILNTLINAEALRSFNLNERTLVENIAVALNFAEIDDELIKKPVIIELDDYSDEVKRNNELESFGYFITNHPASKYQNVMKLEMLEKYLFKNIKCVVLVNRISNIKTKKNENMAFISASDETGTCDFTIFPKNMNLINDLKIGDLVEINGNVSKRFDKVSIIVNNIKKVV
ncbi:DNA polymerase III subunit alpha [bacterium]|nr:DNA polymerase III subunit alpha [bacterium]